MDVFRSTGSTQNLSRTTSPNRQNPQTSLIHKEKLITS